MPKFEGAPLCSLCHRACAKSKLEGIDEPGDRWLWTLPTTIPAPQPPGGISIVGRPPPYTSGWPFSSITGGPETIGPKTTLPPPISHKRAPNSRLAKSFSPNNRSASSRNCLTASAARASAFHCRRLSSVSHCCSSSESFRPPPVSSSPSSSCWLPPPPRDGHCRPAKGDAPRARCR